MSARRGSDGFGLLLLRRCVSAPDFPDFPVYKATYAVRRREDFALLSHQGAYGHPNTTGSYGMLDP